MKHLKKIFAFVLALVMSFGVVTTASAAPQDDLTGGSITINDAVSGQKYDIYQILYLESYSTDVEGNATGAYAYKANSAWSGFVNSDAVRGVYLNIDNQGYVTWVKNADPAAFAKAALAYAQTNKIANDGTQTAVGASVSFSGLKLGYYLVDTTLGTLCSLDTTNPSVVMQEKNEVPTIDKKVQEDSDNSWGESNTAQIGDTVNFKTTVNAKPGAQNYVLHDVMSEGLTLISNSITVKVGATTLTAGTDYTLSTNKDDGCDFEIAFAQTYLNSITKDTTITVEYSAILNGEAVISTDANTNKTKLEYGDDLNGEPQYTPEEETKTYAFSFDIVKTDSNNMLLDGAEFALYGSKDDTDLIPVVYDTEKNAYRVATDEEKNADGFTSATIVATKGQATVIGLDANTTYWLEETKAPAGYNKLDGRVEVAIKDGNLSATLTDSGDQWASGGVHVINQTGEELPSTGGMGTTIFYAVGGALVAGCAVALVARKRLNGSH